MHVFAKFVLADSSVVWMSFILQECQTSWKNVGLPSILLLFFVCDGSSGAVLPDVMNMEYVFWSILLHSPPVHCPNESVKVTSNPVFWSLLFV